ncbi:MAG: hypothetical protein MUQ26_03155 [Armatimonadetes bacterium]|nr:hypothetical protein [Armatimonadota bacterium]
MARKIALLVVAGLLGLGGGSVMAADLNDLASSVLKTAVVGAVVTAAADPMNDAIDRVAGTEKMPAGTDTKVVPVLSLGRKGYVGAAQVSGAANLVGRAKAVLQLETEFDQGRYRIKVLSPVDSLNPLEFGRVQGLGITGLADIALTRGIYRAPRSGSIGAGDVLLGGAILVAVNEFGPQIDDFINSVARTRGLSAEGQTKVVPYLSVGEKAYLGAMQVAGPAEQVLRVKAVWQYEDLFDAGRARLRVLVPSDSLSPLDISRVKGVGCTAIIDMVAIRTREEPGRYGYLRDSGLFVGEDMFMPTRRPPGWDRGRKEGWIKHGDPYLPPGLSRKVAPRGIVIVEPEAGPQPPHVERERARERIRVQETMEPGRAERGRGSRGASEERGARVQQQEEKQGRGRGGGNQGRGGRGRGD